jgi:hypothetical protein
VGDKILKDKGYGTKITGDHWNNDDLVRQIPPAPVISGFMERHQKMVF